MLEKIAKEVRDGRIGGVTDLRDESDHTGMRVVIEVSRQAEHARRAEAGRSSTANCARRLA